MQHSKADRHDPETMRSASGWRHGEAMFRGNIVAGYLKNRGER